MRRTTLRSAILALAGLFVILAACAQMKALPSLPASHPEAQRYRGSEDENSAFALSAPAPASVLTSPV